MEDCLVRPNAAGVKLICAGSSDEALAFTAQYADYACTLGKGVNTPTAFAPVTARLEAAAAKTGRKVGSYLLMMVIADETDEKAMAKWQLYREGEDKDATKWLANQAAPNAKGGANTNTTQLAAAESAVNSPRLCPVTTPGIAPWRSCHNRQHAMPAASMAGCVRSVSLSSSAGPSATSCQRS